ncbi:MAG TPA: guanylate kinase [Lachnospiraceae bacterium]|nr:guanylate kinase [Lachnospiraceae bacterium]
MSKATGILVIVSGFSGAGKGTLMRELLGQYEGYALSVSATTRCPREGEVDGRDYFFIDREEFERMIAGNEFIEHARYVDNYYGTPRKYVEEQLASGRNVILEIEVQGAMIVKQQYPDAITVFVTPPDAAELKRRLEGRKTEAVDVITGRLKRAGEESELMMMYDYLLVNDDLQESTKKLHDIITNAHARMCVNKEFVSRIQKELRAM